MPDARVCRPPPHNKDSEVPLLEPAQSILTLRFVHVAAKGRAGHAICCQLKDRVLQRSSPLIAACCSCNPSDHGEHLAQGLPFMLHERAIQQPLLKCQTDLH